MQCEPRQKETLFMEQREAMREEQKEAGDRNGRGCSWPWALPTFWLPRNAPLCPLRPLTVLVHQKGCLGESAKSLNVPCLLSTVMMGNQSINKWMQWWFLAG